MRQRESPSASPTLPLQLCLSHSATPTMPLPLCLSHSAGPTMPLLLCLSYSASPTLPLSLCLSLSASPTLPPKTPPLPQSEWPLALCPQVALVYTVQHKTRFYCSWTRNASPRLLSVIYQVWNDVNNVDIKKVFSIDDLTMQLNFFLDNSTCWCEKQNLKRWTNYAPSKAFW